MKESTKNSKKNCYLYTRVSTEMQVEGYSLDAQREVLEREAKNRHLNIIEVFADEGKSGKNVAGRPKFQEMMHRIETKQDDVSYVLVYKLSRFGRNAADVLNNVQIMEDYGVHLYSVEDHIDSADEAGKLMISVLASVSEMERENIRVQTMSGRIQKAKEGKWNGGQAPYGYGLSDGVLVVDEYEAELVRMVFDKFVNTSMGMNAVAQWLNDNGYARRVRQNGKFSRIAASFVKNVLDNPVYAGYIAYGRRGSEKIEGKRNEYHRVKKDEYGLYEGKHEAIIDADTWERARLKREKTGVHYQKKYSKEHAHILSGLLICPICGSRMYGVVCRKKKKGKEGEYYDDIWYYRCKRRIKIEGQACSFKTYLRQDIINEQVEILVKDAMKHMDFTDEIQKVVGAMDDSGELREDLKRVEEQKAKEVARKSKILKKIASLDPDDDMYDTMYDDLQEILHGYTKNIADYDAQIRKTTLAIENVENSAVSAQHVQAFLQSIIQDMDTLTMEQERAMMNTLLQSVEIYPERQVEDGAWVRRITFKFPININGELYTDYVRKETTGSKDEDGESFLPKQKPDETVVLMSREDISQQK